jgi:predicted negative regulator of RcsB-dependent stress response
MSKTKVSVSENENPVLKSIENEVDSGATWLDNGWHILAIVSFLITFTLLLYWMYISSKNNWDQKSTADYLKNRIQEAKINATNRIQQAKLSMANSFRQRNPNLSSSEQPSQENVDGGNSYLNRY